MSDEDDRDSDAPDPGPGPLTLPAASRALVQTFLEDGIRAVRGMIDSAREDYTKACRIADREGEDPPKPDLPRTSSDRWISEAADKLVAAGAPVWVPHEDLVAIGEDLASYPLERMLRLPECTLLREGQVAIDLRWTLKPIARKDKLGDVDYNEPRCGRAKVVPEPERLTWAGRGRAPLFRFELSLPWFLLAEDDEIEHGLHDLLAYCGLTGREEDPKPRLRKPDVVAHASTLARFGPRHHREARALAHAQAHPQGRALLQAHGYDPSTGQGLIWPDIDTHRRRSSALFPAPERAGSKARPQAAQPRVGKEIAADPEPLFVADPDEEMEH